MAEYYILVHAWGQTASFRTSAALAPENFQNGLNSLLPDDIVITDCMNVPLDFHARYDAVAKTYQYRILNRPFPSAIARNFSWHVKYSLDLDAMQAALPHITGRHDFKSFEAAGSDKSSTVRKVMAATLRREEGGFVVFEIKADGFLRYMVRNIIGTLVDVGTGKLSPNAIPGILEGRDRALASPTAPPQGLFLVSVEY